MAMYWVEFDHRPGGSVRAETEEEARTVAASKTGFAVKDLWIIPYPAKPVIHDELGVPAFCGSPRSACRGRTSCPHRPACSE